jgi:hypothetical protein
MIAPSGSVYRDRRRAFIAACEGAHVDPIARLHPSRDADGKLLFTDSAALGPRLGSRAVLAIANDQAGSAIMVQLLKSRPALPDDTRLVLVHALDPARFAGVKADPAWSATTLTAVATEDLSRVKLLRILPLGTASLSALPSLAPRQVILLRPATGIADAAAALAGLSEF